MPKEHLLHMAYVDAHVAAAVSENEALSRKAMESMAELIELAGAEIQMLPAPDHDDTSPRPNEPTVFDYFLPSKTTRS